jgi:putative acyl-CoA dehydrogenase
VQRVFARERESAQSVLAAIAADAGELPDTCEWVQAVETALTSPDAECDARTAVERLALLVAAAALRGSAPPLITDLFLRVRLAERRGDFFGTSTISSREADLILRRTFPD